MPPSTETSGPRILIVDDQLSNVRLLEQTLRRAGFTEVMSTIDSCEVVALHLQYRYDVLLLDLQMPQMDGFEVMKALREIRRAHPVSILVISADPAQTAAAVAAGANRFLNKPFRLPDVIEHVQLMLNARASTRIDERAADAAAPLSRET